MVDVEGTKFGVYVNNGDGSDTFEGGAGDDYIASGSGHDLFIYGYDPISNTNGFGFDTIWEMGDSTAQTDTLYLTQDIEQIVLARGTTYSAGSGVVADARFIVFLPEQEEGLPF